jgi:hypothetical protein
MQHEKMYLIVGPQAPMIATAKRSFSIKFLGTVSSSLEALTAALYGRKGGLHGMLVALSLERILEPYESSNFDCHHYNTQRKK